MVTLNKAASHLKIDVHLALVLLVVIVVVLVADSFGHVVIAQSFGAKYSTPLDPKIGSIVGWLLDKQSQFYREMSATIRAAKSDGTAVWTLLAISFAYGIFHAAGPGHGKAVISSYLIANEETAQRGIILAFAAALMQALVAVVLVGICAWLLSATAKTMCNAERVIEIASYALITIFGVRLVWIKCGSLISARQAVPVNAESAHVHDAHCSHNHGPTPDYLAGPGGWRRGVSAIFAVGLRPCSGAILVLVFALAQGIFWAGIVATFLMGLGTAITIAVIAIMSVFAKGLAQRISISRESRGILILRGIEFCAAGCVLLVGVGLLFGYVVAERATCF